MRPGSRPGRSWAPCLQELRKNQKRLTKKRCSSKSACYPINALLHCALRPARAHRRRLQRPIALTLPTTARSTSPGHLRCVTNCWPWCCSVGPAACPSGGRAQPSGLIAGGSSAGLAPPVAGLLLKARSRLPVAEPALPAGACLTADFARPRLPWKALAWPLAGLHGWHLLQRVIRTCDVGGRDPRALTSSWRATARADRPCWVKRRLGPWLPLWPFG